ncbi:MAG: type II toxin-antitoxin system ParD family antitoxin [Sphingobium sp.]
MMRSFVAMGTMNIFLPDTLEAFVDEQVAGRGYGTIGEYVRELIRQDRDRHNLRALLVEGAGSRPTQAVDEAYFAALRHRARAPVPE